MSLAKFDKARVENMMKKLPEYFNVLLEYLSNLAKFLRNSKIQTRLIISFLFLSFFMLVVTGAVAYSNSSSAIEKKIRSYSVQVMDQLGQNIYVETQKFKNYLDEITFSALIQEKAPQYNSMEDFDKLTLNRDISALFNSKFLSVSAISDVVLIFEDKTKINYSVASNSAIVDANADKILKQAADAKGVPSWSFIKGDTPENNYLILSRVINSTGTGQQIGTLVFSLKEKSLSDIYGKVVLGDEKNPADIFIMDSNGIVISSNNPKITTGNPYTNAELIKKLKKDPKQQEQVFPMNLNGSKYLVSFSYIKDCEWYAVCVIPYSYLNAESSSMKNTIIFLGIICFIIALILSYVISRSISMPLEKLVRLMKEAKNGNLAINIVDRSKDEIGEVTSNFNEMVSNIRLLVSQVHSSSQNVLTSAEKIAASSERSYMVSEQVAITIQQIAKGSSEQATEAAEGVTNMNVLSDRINKVGNDMGTVSGVVSNTKKLSEEALTSVKSLNDKAMETNTVSEKIIEDIISLNNDMKQIKNIVKVIVGIAEQTNLLSLNAAIEAARAGEAGRGFAVVAEEVKKLADQSKEASITISNIISNIQQKTEHTVNAANNASTIIRQQMDAVHETDSAFKTIFGAMENISRYIDGVAASVDDILGSKQKTLESIENISAVSEQAAATVQEVSASTQEQMAGTEELSSLAKNLNEMAQQLDKAISIFKT